MDYYHNYTKRLLYRCGLVLLFSYSCLFLSTGSANVEGPRGAGLIIESSPVDIVGVKGKVITLECRARKLVESIVRMDQRWMKDWVWINFDESNTYKLEDGVLSFNLNDRTAGRYACGYETDGGIFIGHPFAVDIAQIKGFAAQPSNTTVSIGETARFECHVFDQSTNPIPVYSWLHDGQPIFDSTNDRITILNSGILQIVNVSSVDIGQYKCVASNIADRIETRSALLTIGNGRSMVEESDVLLAKPVPGIVKGGDSFDLECLKEWVGRNSSIEWQGNNMVQHDNNGMVRDSIVVSKAALRDAKIYSCILRDGLSGVMVDIGSATVNVSTDPSFINNKDFKNIIAKTTHPHAVRFTAKIRIQTAPLEILWLKNGLPVLPTDYDGISYAPTKSRGYAPTKRMYMSDFRIHHPVIQDQAIYQCLVRTRRYTLGQHAGKYDEFVSNGGLFTADASLDTLLPQVYKPNVQVKNITDKSFVVTWNQCTTLSSPVKVGCSQYLVSIPGIQYQMSMSGASCVNGTCSYTVKDEEVNDDDRDRPHKQLFRVKPNAKYAAVVIATIDGPNKKTVYASMYRSPPVFFQTLKDPTRDAVAMYPAVASIWYTDDTKLIVEVTGPDKMDGDVYKVEYRTEAGDSRTISEVPEFVESIGTFRIALDVSPPTVDRVRVHRLSDHPTAGNPPPRATNDKVIEANWIEVWHPSQDLPTYEPRLPVIHITSVTELRAGVLDVQWQVGDSDLTAMGAELTVLDVRTGRLIASKRFFIGTTQTYLPDLESEALVLVQMRTFSTNDLLGPTSRLNVAILFYEMKSVLHDVCDWYMFKIDRISDIGPYNFTVHLRLDMVRGTEDRIIIQASPWDATQNIAKVTRVLSKNETNKRQLVISSVLRGLVPNMLYEVKAKIIGSSGAHGDKSDCDSKWLPIQQRKFVNTSIAIPPPSSVVVLQLSNGSLNVTWLRPTERYAPVRQYRLMCYCDETMHQGFLVFNRTVPAYQRWVYIYNGELRTNGSYVYCDLMAGTGHYAEWGDSYTFRIPLHGTSDQYYKQAILIALCIVVALVLLCLIWLFIRSCCNKSEHHHNYFNIFRTCGGRTRSTLGRCQPVRSGVSTGTTGNTTGDPSVVKWPTDGSNGVTTVEMIDIQHRLLPSLEAALQLDTKGGVSGTSPRSLTIGESETLECDFFGPGKSPATRSRTDSNYDNVDRRLLTASYRNHQIVDSDEPCCSASIANDPSDMETSRLLTQSSTATTPIDYQEYSDQLRCNGDNNNNNNNKTQQDDEYQVKSLLHHFNLPQAMLQQQPPNESPHQSESTRATRSGATARTDCKMPSENDSVYRCRPTGCADDGVTLSTLSNPSYYHPKSGICVPPVDSSTSSISSSSPPRSTQFSNFKSTSDQSANIIHSSIPELPNQNERGYPILSAGNYRHPTYHTTNTNNATSPSSSCSDAMTSSVLQVNTTDLAPDDCTSTALSTIGSMNSSEPNSPQVTLPTTSSDPDEMELLVEVHNVYEQMDVDTTANDENGSGCSSSRNSWDSRASPVDIRSIHQSTDPSNRKKDDVTMIRSINGYRKANSVSTDGHDHDRNPTEIIKTPNSGRSSSEDISRRDELNANFLSNRLPRVDPSNEGRIRSSVNFPFVSSHYDSGIWVDDNSTGIRCQQRHRHSQEDNNGNHTSNPSQLRTSMGTTEPEPMDVWSAGGVHS